MSPRSTLRGLARGATKGAWRALSIVAASAALGCGNARPADGPHAPGEEDELPDPKAPTDLPDDPTRPVDDGDKPLVDPAKETGTRASPASPAASSSARPKR